MKMTHRRPTSSVGAAAMLFALTFNVQNVNATFSARIVGGQDADVGEYSFFSSWSTSCGATVIHDDILLTAAHVRLRPGQPTCIHPMTHSLTLSHFPCFLSFCSVVPSLMIASFLVPTHEVKRTNQNQSNRYQEE